MAVQLLALMQLDMLTEKRISDKSLLKQGEGICIGDSVGLRK